MPSELAEPPSSAVEVRRHASKGRALHATKTFNLGQIIHVFANPLILHPSLSHLSTVCTHCLRPGSPRACSRCHAAYYCDASCQQAGWTAVHANECKPLRQRRLGSRAGSELPTPVRALVQTLLKKEIEGGVDGLEGHAAQKRQTAQWPDLEMMGMAACAFAGREGSEGDVKRAVDLLCKIQTNAFHRYDVDLGQVGIFLEPTLAMANHSCIPNALVQFIGRKAILRAEMPIKSGEEIVISYTDYTMPLSKRREALSPYSFECQCHRCMNDLNVYQVCSTSPTISLNKFSVAGNLGKLKNHPAVSESSLQSTAQKYSKEPDQTPESLPERRTALFAQASACKQLIEGDLWATSPLPQILTELSIYYTEEGNYAFALAIACFVATSCDPYRYVAPFHQVRVKNIFMIAKLLANTAEGSATLEQPLTAVASKARADQKVQETLKNIDQVSLCQMLLLMILKMGPVGHEGEWELCVSAREMLEDIERLPGREKEVSLINSWRESPDDESCQAFFEYAVVQQVETLATMGRGLLNIDVDGA